MKPLTIVRGYFNGKRVYQRRIELGFTIEQLAILVHRSATTVYFWESGKRSPTPSGMAALSKALHVSPAYFFDGALK